MLGGVVENLAFRPPHDVFQRRVLEFGAFDELVQLVDVGLVVLAVVELHRFARNMGLQCFFGYGRGGQFVFHGDLLKERAHCGPGQCNWYAAVSGIVSGRMRRLRVRKYHAAFGGICEKHGPPCGGQTDAKGEWPAMTDPGAVLQ